MASADRTRFSPEGSLALSRRAARADMLVGRPVTVRPGSGDGRNLLSPVRRTVVTVVLLLLLPAGMVLAYWAGEIDRLEMRAALAPTELAPGAVSSRCGVPVRAWRRTWRSEACQRRGPTSTMSCGSAVKAGVAASAPSWWTTGDGASSPPRVRRWPAVTSAAASP
jgi:hypothetical protein